MAESPAKPNAYELSFTAKTQADLDRAADAFLADADAEDNRARAIEMRSAARHIRNGSPHSRSMAGLIARSLGYRR